MQYVKGQSCQTFTQHEVYEHKRADSDVINICIAHNNKLYPFEAYRLGSLSYEERKRRIGKVALITMPCEDVPYEHLFISTTDIISFIPTQLREVPYTATTYEKILHVLRNCLEARSDDSILWLHIAALDGLDTKESFCELIKQHKLPNFKTIIRIRRLVQIDYPHLIDIEADIARKRARDKYKIMAANHTRKNFVELPKILQSEGYSVR